MIESNLYQLQIDIKNSDCERKTIANILKDLSIEEKIKLRNIYQERNRELQDKIELYRSNIEKIREDIYSIRKQSLL